MTPYRFRNAIRITLGIAAVLILGLAAVAYPESAVWPGWPEALVTALVIAFIVNYSIPMPVGEGSLVHLVSLGNILVYSPLSITAVAAAGVLLGDVVRSVWRRGPGYRDMPLRDRVGLAAFDVAQHVFSLLAAFALYSWAGGRHPFTGFSTVNIYGLLGFVGGFYAGYNALLLIDLYLRGETLRRYISLNRRSMLVLELVPIPFSVFGALLNSQLGFWAYVTMVSLVAVVSVVMHTLGRARIQAEKRLREITLINNVSQAMRSSLDLDSLLEIIYQQVASLLGVQNFYVALHDLETGMINFPIAVKEGQRAAWAPRPFANRLTDYVIRTSSPLLVPYDVPNALQELGLEAGITQPQAWLGVPLLTGERAIGCMAVLTYAPGGALPPEAQTFLVTTAAQAGAAIENAQMYGQQTRRATELSTLTEISTTMSASLDPERVLDLVCSSVIGVFGAQKSAIFLLTEDRQTLQLARSKGLTDAYLTASATISMDDEDRVRAITTGQPVVAADTAAANLAPDFAELARAEGFGAFAELPLAAQGEIIGFLAVYFSGPRRFRGAEIDLLKTFATQAALAVYNARVYARADKALARRVEQLQALETISRELTSTLDLDRLFQVILDRAMEYTGATAGSLFLFNIERDCLALTASRGYPPGVPSCLSVTDRSITVRVHQTGQAAFVPDVRHDPDYADMTGNTLSQLSIPIAREAKTLGVITLESSVLDGFSQDDASFVSQMAAQAAVAIDNARLFSRVTEGRDLIVAVLNSTREGVLMIEGNGRVALANPPLEEMLGIKRRDVIGQQLTDLIARPDMAIAERLGYAPEVLLDLLENISAGRMVIAPKQTYQVNTPTPRFFDRSGTPVLDEDIRVIGWVITLRDITEEKDIEEVREELSRMIIHDLRSPMTAVLGSLRLIEDLAVPADKSGIISRALEVSTRSSQRLLALVDSMLDISKMEAGQMTFDLKPHSLRAIAQNAITSLDSLATEQEIVLLNQVPPDLPLLRIDQDKVMRVFTNLIDNSLKFTPSGGQIALGAFVEESPPRRGVTRRFAICQVLDTGPGIPDEYRERIFDRFAQVKGRKGRRAGSGLGLAFCKLAVEAQGGRIWVENRPEGGSAFSFTLPLAE